MNTSYNRIAGTSVERLAALSDGIFGVAMTLLLLELRIPAKELIHNEGDLWRALGGLAPHLLVYLMSFITLGIFWVGQQTQLNHLMRLDRDLTWIHLAFLFTVTLLAPIRSRSLDLHPGVPCTLEPIRHEIALREEADAANTSDVQRDLARNTFRVMDREEHETLKDAQPRR